MRRHIVKTYVRDATRTALVRRLSDYDAVVEIGVGRRPDVASALADTGLDVTVTDIRQRPVPDGVTFVVDDITDPDRTVYADADVLFARNLPPELHRPAWELAADLGVVLYFTTLGSDPTLVPVSRETLPGTTLFVATPGTNPKQA